jgi:Cyclopropane fatty acid synthase and related methyltransferases
MVSENKDLSLGYPDTSSRGQALELRYPSVHANSRVSAAEKWILRKILTALGDLPIRVVLWDDEGISTSRTAPVASLHIGNRRTLIGLLTNGELNFGDAYAEGRLDVRGDLVKFLEIAYRATTHAFANSFLRRMLLRVFTSTGVLASMGAHGLRPRPNTLPQSRENIHHHYDLGNDFYRLWLDEQMVYTCAYFSSPTLSLEQAQIAKMDHVCHKLRLKPGETVAEAGCGWGSLALHMARHYGVKVKAFNISHEQIVYAREWAKREGLSEEVEYIEDDYRNINGSFDAFVSVGMLEHVGRRNYRELGRVIDRCLKDDGRGLIHSIGRNQPRLMSTWIEKRIFPGAYPPTIREMMDVFEPFNFSVLDIENLRLHYAKTLEHWLKRYENAAETLTEMFDSRFVRTWRLYLAGSISAFTTSSLQLFQVVFARATNNDIPWTRAHLYSRSSAKHR